MRDDGGSDQGGGSSDGEKWSYSGCILKREMRILLVDCIWGIK